MTGGLSKEPRGAWTRPSMRPVVLAVLGLAAPVTSWVTISQSYWGAKIDDIMLQMRPESSSSVEPVQRLGYLWSQPETTSESKGLGGGITWAFDPTLCENILPSFSEQPVFGISVIDCNQIRASIHRGFATWSDNSAKLTFIDVTQECAQNGTPDVTCPYAEVFVTWLTDADLDAMKGSSGEENRRRSLTMVRAAASGTNASSSERRALEALEAPQVELSPTMQEMSAGGTTAALARSFPAYTSDFRSTNGVEPSGLVVETTRATIAFNPTLCWYLDSKFCSVFHYSKVSLAPLSTDQIAWIVRGGLLLLWIFALVRFIQHFYIVASRILEDKSEEQNIAQLGHAALSGDPIKIAEEVQAQAKRLHNSVRAKADAALDAIAHQRATGWMSRGVLLVSPITFYFSVFMPCWECFDFEAAAAHEIGHVLGLSHPDEIPLTAPGRPGEAGGVNTMLSANVSRAGGFDCLRPWASAVEGPNGTDVRPSIMRTLTQHNPTVCLSEDDLEALNVLYPDCSASLITVPVCYYQRKYIGMLRFLAITLIPIVITMVVVIAINELVRARQKKKEEDLHTKIQEKERLQDEETKLMVKKILQEQHKAERKRRKKRLKKSDVAPDDGHDGHDDLDDEHSMLGGAPPPLAQFGHSQSSLEINDDVLHQHLQLARASCAPSTTNGYAPSAPAAYAPRAPPAMPPPRAPIQQVAPPPPAPYPNPPLNYAMQPPPPPGASWPQRGAPPSRQQLPPLQQPPTYPL